MTSRSAAGSPPIAHTDTWRATLGCLQLPTDLTLDEEGPALIAQVPGVRLRLRRIELDGDGVDESTFRSARGRLARAAATLRPAGSLDVIGMACTSLSFTLGCEAVQEELRAGQPGSRVTDMASAVLRALEQMATRRLALLTPYVDELHARNLRFLREAGYQVVAQRNLGLATDRSITALGPDSVFAAAVAADAPDADTFVLGCSAFRACGPGFLDRLEERLGKPVVASQQAFLWHLLRLAGVEDLVGGYGSLLAGRDWRGRRRSSRVNRRRR